MRSAGFWARGIAVPVLMAVGLFGLTVSTSTALAQGSDGAATTSPSQVQPLQQRPQQRQQPPAQSQPPPAQAPQAAPMMRQGTETSADQLLDDDLVADPGRIAAARAKAQEAPPSTGDAATLAAFFHVRGQAAATAGMTGQTLSDLRAALRHAERAGSIDLTTILVDLANAEANIRKHVTAARLLRRAIELVPQQQRGRVVVYNARLAVLLANSGDLEGAQRALG
jgi:hypothetical protein